MWLFLWRASLLYIFPLLMWAYCRIKEIEFAELDTGRRERLAAMVADCEQVIITAAVPADVPTDLVGRTFSVTLGSLSERD